MLKMRGRFLPFFGQNRTFIKPNVRKMYTYKKTDIWFLPNSENQMSAILSDKCYKNVYLKSHKSTQNVNFVLTHVNLLFSHLTQNQRNKERIFGFAWLYRIDQ